MADEVIEMPLILENVLRYCLNNARDRMLKGEQINPFSALAVGETLFMEEHVFDTPDECFASAKRTVEKARGARTYGFCYDGYVDTAFGRSDALIAQGGMPGEPYGYAIGLIYKIKDDGTYDFHADPIFVGPAANYMCLLSLDDEEVEDEAADEAREDRMGERGLAVGGSVAWPQGGRCIAPRDERRSTSGGSGACPQGRPDAPPCGNARLA